MWTPHNFICHCWFILKLSVIWIWLALCSWTYIISHKVYHITFWAFVKGRKVLTQTCYQSSATLWTLAYVHWAYRSALTVVMPRAPSSEAPKIRSSLEKFHPGHNLIPNKMITVLYKQWRCGFYALSEVCDVQRYRGPRRGPWGTLYLFSLISLNFFSRD